MKTFKTFGQMEGASFLILLFIAMPLKYLAGLPLAVRVVGMTHGLLFIGYVISTHLLASEAGWSMRKRFWAYAAAFVPFGTFIFNRKALPYSF